MTAEPVSDVVPVGVPNDRGNLKPDGINTWEVDEPPSIAAEPVGDIARLRALAQAALDAETAYLVAVDKALDTPKDSVEWAEADRLNLAAGDAFTPFIAEASPAVVEWLCNQLDEANKRGQALADALDLNFPGQLSVPYPNFVAARDALDAWRKHTAGEAQ